MALLQLFLTYRDGQNVTDEIRRIFPFSPVLKTTTLKANQMDEFIASIQKQQVPIYEKESTSQSIRFAEQMAQLKDQQVRFLFEK